MFLGRPRLGGLIARGERIENEMKVEFLKAARDEKNKTKHQPTAEKLNNYNQSSDFVIESSQQPLAVAAIASEMKFGTMKSHWMGQ